MWTEALFHYELDNELLETLYNYATTYQKAKQELDSLGISLTFLLETDKV